MVWGRHEERLRRADFALLTGFCLLLFGISLVSGRPLTMHEGVLPETSREMFHNHSWIIPTNAGRPWLENPPLPQWITVGIATLCGGCDDVWIVRIGPMLVSTIAVLLVAWMAAGWFGRSIGLLSGFVLATTYEFTQYAWLAEDEIFLCTLTTLAVAAFARTEFFLGDSSTVGSRTFFGMRPGSLLTFSIALGMTNFAKGILFGAAMVVIPIGGYLLWNRDLSRIRYYCWFWGWLVFAALTIAWPLAAWIQLPEVLDLWKFDHVGRLDGTYDDMTQPWYYYLKVLPTNLAPWTIVIPLAFWFTRQEALRERFSPERFLWCWALLPPLVFSIPTGKHHHYLLHCMAPWAVLTAQALPRLHAQICAWPERMRNPLNSLFTLAIPGDIALWFLRSKIAGPDWLVPALLIVWPAIVLAFSWATSQPRGFIAAGGLFTVVAAGFGAGHLYAAAYKDQCREDTAFLQAVPGQVPADQPIVLNTELGSLDECRIQFYLADRVLPLHNLTFLADEKLPQEMYLIARAGHSETIQHYGDVNIVSQSVRTRREKTPADRLTLFHVRLHDSLPRYSTMGIRVSPMQAMGRAPGPLLGQTDEPMRR